MDESATHIAVEAVARNSFGRLIAYLAARSGDVAGAEDALGDAFVAALERWPADGIPQKPEAWKAYGEALQAAGVFVGGAGLESPQAATTVSVRDGKRQVHDGPYAETKEFLAGFAVIEVPNLDVALEWAARHPAAAHAAMEVRPLLGSYFAVGAPKPS